jgi:hypothetical protein
LLTQASHSWSSGEPALPSSSSASSEKLEVASLCGSTAAWTAPRSLISTVSASLFLDAAQSSRWDQFVEIFDVLFNPALHERGDRAVKMCRMVFSPQPVQEPSPQAIDW